MTLASLNNSFHFQLGTLRILQLPSDELSPAFPPRPAHSTIPHSRTGRETQRFAAAPIHGKLTRSANVASSRGTVGAATTSCGHPPDALERHFRTAVLVPPFKANDVRTEFFARERTDRDDPLTLSVTPRDRRPKAPNHPRRPNTRAIPLAYRKARVSPNLEGPLQLAAHHRDPFQKPERLLPMSPTTPTVRRSLALASPSARYSQTRAPHLGFTELRRGRPPPRPKLCRLGRASDTRSPAGFHRRARPSRQTGSSPVPERHMPLIDFCNQTDPRAHLVTPPNPTDVTSRLARHRPPDPLRNLADRGTSTQGSTSDFTTGSTPANSDRSLCGLTPTRSVLEHPHVAWLAPIPTGTVDTGDLRYGSPAFAGPNSPRHVRFSPDATTMPCLPLGTPHEAPRERNSAQQYPGCFPPNQPRIHSARGAFRRGAPASVSSFLERGAELSQHLFYRSLPCPDLDRGAGARTHLRGRRSPGGVNPLVRPLGPGGSQCLEGFCVRKRRRLMCRGTSKTECLTWRRYLQ